MLRNFSLIMVILVLSGCASTSPIAKPDKNGIITGRPVIIYSNE